MDQDKFVKAYLGRMAQKLAPQGFDPDLLVKGIWKGTGAMVKNDGTRTFTPEQLLHMDWLCENVIGEIPPFEEILPISRNMVRELGIYRDTIPPEKEVKKLEDFDHLR